MAYHNLVKAGFAFCCALMLQITIGAFGDKLISPNKANAAVSAVQSPAHNTVASIANK